MFLSFRDLMCSTERLSRSAYLRLGLILMLVKFSIDALVYALVVGGLWDPLDYLNPIYALRMSGAPDAAELPPLYVVFLVLWGLVFAWIGTMLSSRRASDAGKSPWWGLLFFVPVINYLLIIALACLPTAVVPDDQAEDEGVERPAEPWMQTPSRESASALADHSPTPSRFFLVLVSGAALLATMIAMTVVLFVGAQSYGTAAFLSFPIAYGVALGLCLNWRGMVPFGSNLAFAAGSTLVACSALLIAGLEGAICIAMAFPILFVAVSIGIMLGRTLLVLGRPGKAAPLCLLFAIPTSAWIDTRLPKLPPREVASQIVIDAPPEVVWHRVVAFAELPEPEDWWFHTGLAYPLRARIEGEGVGAIRYCEFSTGAFVEPITVWDEPHRLGFDVTEQPVPMEEWSFYDDISPPHLEHSFRSLRGEFRLIPLDGGRTRLEGSTWYELDMAPAVYWRLWGDAVIHRIHDRVLRHVKQLSEEVR